MMSSEEDQDGVLQETVFNIPFSTPTLNCQTLRQDSVTLISCYAAGLNIAGMVLAPFTPLPT